ncbi:MAG: putative Ig domain-containing protein [Balneolaceae bacterium]
MMSINRLWTLLILLVALMFPAMEPLHAQSLIRDTSQRMTMPGIQAISSSETHLYLLSEQEGLAVFRSHADSLQWLYTSEGMERRGSHLTSDSRFSYLHGDGTSLTIIEPTSLLGVYSSTTLPHPLSAVQRLHDRLYLILNGRLFTLSLESPNSVDQPPVAVLDDDLSGRTLIDLISDQRGTLYLLDEEGDVHIVRQPDAASPVNLDRTVETGRTIERLFLVQSDLLGTTRDGTVYRIGSEGGTERRFQAESSIFRLQEWGPLWVLSGQDGTIDVVHPERGETTRLRDSRIEPALFTVADDRLWIVEQNRVTPILRGESDDPVTNDQPVRLNPIENFATPTSQPVLIPLERSPRTDTVVDFAYESETIDNARIRGSSFYWTPGPSDTGRHTIKITAIPATGERTTTQFDIDVRPFNTPPRFTPIPRQRIPAGEEWELELRAFDPDGQDSELIRYIGVDLPEGLSLDERRGHLLWTPERTQVGDHRFQIIATDQFGAANNVRIQISVTEASRESEQEFPFE